METLECCAKVSLNVILVVQQSVPTDNTRQLAGNMKIGILGRPTEENQIMNVRIVLNLIVDYTRIDLHVMDGALGALARNQTTAHCVHTDLLFTVVLRKNVPRERTLHLVQALCMQTTSVCHVTLQHASTDQLHS